MLEDLYIRGCTSDSSPTLVGREITQPKAKESVSPKATEKQKHPELGWIDLIPFVGQPGSEKGEDKVCVDCITFFNLFTFFFILIKLFILYYLLNHLFNSFFIVRCKK